MKFRRVGPPPVYDPTRNFRFSYDQTPPPVPAPTLREQVEPARPSALTTLLADPLSLEKVPDMQPSPEIPPHTVHHATPKVHDCGPVEVGGYYRKGNYVHGYMRNHPKSKWCP